MSDTPSKPEDVADALFTAIAAADFAAVDNLYDPEVAIWHNFSGTEQDKATNLQALRQARDRYEMSYEIVDRTITGSRVIQQHILTARLQDGQTFTLPAAMFITVRDGLITRIEEYLDTAQLNAMRNASGQ